ncbi:hypothetical protein ISM_03745 [Roseovarius nubinhibens ISM]|uniref:Uncharacterized protein n=1 Tax=Roseovarius nubinhibens (strain ATCC BAA-591 / DSM 15170 / ISM) TaxID=89187 RepID=A3SJ41_ROSNI|nr:hypothetical protein ISM_03745 [Roseovarius nubinhibens ISM]
MLMPRLGQAFAQNIKCYRIIVDCQDFHFATFVHSSFVSGIVTA